MRGPDVDDARTGNDRLLPPGAGQRGPQARDLVRGMGADYGQGSLFGVPQPLDELPGLRAALARSRGEQASVPGARVVDVRAPRGGVPGG